MKAVVVDSNIVFSALRSLNRSLREKLVDNRYNFTLPGFLFVEIFKHKERILMNTSASEEDVLDYLSKVLHQIHFINEDFITTAVFLQAYELCKDVDEKDTTFVALALTLDAQIWTRDEQLKAGVRLKGFDLFVRENEFR